MAPTSMCAAAADLQPSAAGAGARSGCTCQTCKATAASSWQPSGAHAPPRPGSLRQPMLVGLRRQRRSPQLPHKALRHAAQHDRDVVVRGHSAVHTELKHRLLLRQRHACSRPGPAQLQALRKRRGAQPLRCPLQSCDTHHCYAQLCHMQDARRLGNTTTRTLSLSTWLRTQIPALLPQGSVAQWPGALQARHCCRLTLGLACRVGINQVSAAGGVLPQQGQRRLPRPVLPLLVQQQQAVPLEAAGRRVAGARQSRVPSPRLSRSCRQASGWSWAVEAPVPPSLWKLQAGRWPAWRAAGARHSRLEGAASSKQAQRRREAATAFRGARLSWAGGSHVGFRT